MLTVKRFTFCRICDIITVAIIVLKYLTDGKTNMNRSNNLKESAVSSHFRKINRQMIVGWLIIAVVLIITYSLEVVKQERTLTYLFIFIPIVTLPLLAAFIIYLKKPDWQRLCYVIVPGYFVMYVFVMITGNTTMVFSYILPMLSLLILYHHPRLILFTGIAALSINLASIFAKYSAGLLNLSSSKDAEIQVALIILCFGGCYFASRLYDNLTKQNYQYVQALNEKNEHIQSMSLQTLTTIARMLDAKDPYTEGHSQRVSVYSVQLAEACGMSQEEIDNLRKVALLHDIGKIGITDTILNKPGRLTDEEFDIMKGHTVTGGDIIKDIRTVPNIYEGVRYHHERYDGRGYPEGLKGEDIPYIARIIAVADAYDAMTSNRVYRQHLNEEKVLSELEHGAGTQFDPVISQKMITLIHDGAIRNLSPDYN